MLWWWSSRASVRVAWNPLRLGITTSISTRSDALGLGDFDAGGAVFGGQRLMPKLLDDTFDTQLLNR